MSATNRLSGSGKYEALLDRCRGLDPIPTAVAHPCEETALAGAIGARLAVDYFVYRAMREIGALAAVLGGIDGLVFTAGIGENSDEIRRRIIESSAWLGLEIDGDANKRHGPRITRAGSRVSAWASPTNEELIIARHTSALLRQ